MRSVVAAPSGGVETSQPISVTKTLTTAAYSIRIRFSGPAIILPLQYDSPSRCTLGPSREQRVKLAIAVSMEHVMRTAIRLITIISLLVALVAINAKAQQTGSIPQNQGNPSMQASQSTFSS